MVVITAFLLKKAYDRYNSSNSDDISASEHTRDTNTNNYPTQKLRRINSSPDRLNSYQRRANNTTTNYNNNNTTHRVVNGRIYKTRRSSSIRNNTNRRYSSTASNNNSSRYNFRNIMTIETNKKEEVIIPTKYGYFVSNPKTKVISLPPEKTIPSNYNTVSSNNDTSSSGDNAIIKLDFETPSKLPTTTTTINNNGIIQNNPSIVTEAPTVATSTDNTRTIDRYTINNTNTTFRNDIRNDWVDAIFGKDFFPLQTNNNINVEGQENGLNNSKRENIRDNIGIKQGTGAAGISHYVTYGAILDPNSTRLIKPSYSGNSSTATPSSSKVQSKTQSTPLIFASPSSSSLLNNTSLVSAACGAVSTPADIINNEEEEGGAMQHGFETPLPNNGNGMGGAKYTIEGTIPPPPSTRNTSSSTTSSSPKLGITISRIPIALYVQSISTNSEAYTVGISPGSILVDVNGLGMLGERSDRALERLWMYAGLFSNIDYNTNTNNGEEGGNKKNQESIKKSKSGNNLNGSSTTTTNSSSNSTNNEHPQDLQMKKPLLLKFYKSGRTYTTLLLSGKPLQGINWAPVGNFALVHKVSLNSIAAEAGVRRGTLVVGVSSSNGKVEGLRTLDHGGVARILKDRFSNGVSICLCLICSSFSTS